MSICVKGKMPFMLQETSSDGHSLVAAHMENLLRFSFKRYEIHHILTEWKKHLKVF